MACRLVDPERHTEEGRNLPSREVHESRGCLLVLTRALSSLAWTESRLDQQLSAGDWVASEMLSSGALDFAAKLGAKHCSFVIPRVTCLQISRSVMCRGNNHSNGAERTCNSEIELDSQGATHPLPLSK